jgi:phosphate transport system protein
MMDLVRTQVSKAHLAFENLDRDTAREVMHYENRVNALEMSIDGDCEQLFQHSRLRNVSLRFVLTCLKVNTQLERIGDHADMMARVTLQRQEAYPSTLLEQLQLTPIFYFLIMMLNDAAQGFNFEDANFSRRVFTNDAQLREITSKMMPIIVQYGEGNPKKIQEILLLTSYIQKMERIGELTKNIAEETIFYLEKSVLRHKDKH